MRTNKVSTWLKRVFVSSLYAVSLFIATGVPQTAMAISCNDLVPGTSVRYSDALVHFVYDGHRTYAIAKSAVTGSRELPDAFFAFSSGIDREYQYSGKDTASLKLFVNSGKYGAARAIFIDSKAKQDFIIKEFRQYLGTAESAKSTYIDAWKEFGVNQPFTTMAGGSLPFTSWPGGVAPDVANITAPQAVVMGSDGVWKNGESAQRISQVVEFDGKLDCAFDANSATQVTPPPPPQLPPTDPNAILDLICSQDLNADGEISSNELQNCLKTPQGDFCPVGALDCTASYQSPTCPQGSTFNPKADMCQADPQIQCPTGYTWDTSIDRCKAAASCPDGGTFNPVTDRCEKIVANDCPAGYTYDGNQSSSTFDKCTMNVQCLAGGAYVSARDRCEKPWTAVCDTAQGFTYNPSSGQCEASPVCTSGSYNPTYNLCMKPYVPQCPTGFTYVPERNRCEALPQCPSGASFNIVTNKCEVASSPVTTTGYAQPTSGKTTITKYQCRGATNPSSATSSPTCLDSLSFNFTVQNGQVVLAQECAWGGSGNCGCASPHWNGWCRSGTDLTQTRTGNTLTVTATIFDYSTDYSSPYCASGYTLQYDYEGGYYCAGCPYTDPYEGGTYYQCYDTVQYVQTKQYTTGATASADLSEFFSCPPGYTVTPPPSTSQCTAIVTQWGNQTGILDCSQASTYTCTAPVSACPSGTTLSGNMCIAASNPTCSAGTFDYATHSCFTPIIKQCDDGFSYDAGSNQCVKAPSCSSGVLNTVSDRCEVSVVKDCGAYALDSQSNLCFSSPVCGEGAYDASLKLCEASVTKNCANYSWDVASANCISPISCPTDSAFPLYSTIQYSDSLDSCLSDVVHDCIQGTTYAGLPSTKCEAVPICDGAVSYDPAQHACFVGNNTCPLGTQYACMNNPHTDTMQCSANSCFNQATPPGGEIEITMDESMYQDDARNPDGSCGGQIMIFAGKPSRCRPPGLKVGYMNNCCESDQMMSEDVGNTAQAAVTGIKTLYEIGQVAYYSYMVSTGAYTATTVGGVTTIATTGGATVASLSGAVGSGVAAGASAGAAGATTAGSMMASMQAYASALLNPTTIVIAVVVMVVMKVLMGSGCDQTDIQTGGQVESKQCHYIGDYCEKKWPLVGCVQKAKGYCCFNSMMARIIHEQGRPQLTTFGADGAWGTPSSPNCRGFVPGEFESLDFAKIDMNEYFGELQKDMATKIQNAQDKINATIQQRTEQIKNGK